MGCQHTCMAVLVQQPDVALQIASVLTCYHIRNTTGMQAIKQELQPTIHCHSCI